MATTPSRGSSVSRVTRWPTKAENMKMAPWAKFRMPIVPHTRAMPRANSR